MQKGCAVDNGRSRASEALVPGHYVAEQGNADLQEELDSMKADLKEHVKLSPLDASKDLLVWSDAAPSEGMAYVLAQWKDPKDQKKGVNIVSCDSTTFKQGKRSLSPFEAELAGVHWAGSDDILSNSIFV